MKIGTKSVLFGVHCLFIHPFFVAIAWTKLYGFPLDLRLWVAFFVHDLGYWGKPNMDGEEGEEHVLLGARIMLRFFGKRWSDFTLYHSRFYAKKNNAQYSRLCVADKYSFICTPRWLYILMATWSGEIYEYMTAAEKYKRSNYLSFADGDEYTSKIKWHNDCKNYMTQWAIEHKDIKEDSWTKTDY